MMMLCPDAGKSKVCSTCYHEKPHEADDSCMKGFSLDSDTCPVCITDKVHHAEIAEIGRLKACNADLLAALEGVMNSISFPVEDIVDSYHYLFVVAEKAYAAIAKAKEES